MEREYIPFHVWLVSLNIVFVRFRFHIVIKWVPKSGGTFSALDRGKRDYGRAVRKKQRVGFANGGGRLGPKVCGWPLEAGKGKGTDSLLEPPERKVVLRCFDFTQVRSTLDLRPIEISDTKLCLIAKFVVICYSSRY